MSHVSKPITLPLVAAILLVIAGCDSGAPASGRPPGGPVAVSVTTLTAERVPLSVELPGRTSAFRIAEVRPQVSGIVLERLFEEGSEVKSGQQLYQIDPATYRAAVRSAEADLARARANLKSVQAKAVRYADLVKINAISRQDYDDAVAAQDQAKADILVAQAALETARINLEYTKVYAPISGHIGKSSVTEGALVTASQSTPIATITQLDPIYVDLSQSITDLMRLRQAMSSGQVERGESGGTPVTLMLDGTAQTYGQTGQLKFSDVTVDETTGSVQVRAVFPNPEQALYPGLFVRARIAQGVRDNALLVPQQAVVRNPDGSAAVWVVGADGKVAQRPVVTAQSVGDKWLIESGLQAGERVVTEGLQRLRPGAEVLVAESPGGQPAVAERDR